MPVAVVPAVPPYISRLPRVLRIRSGAARRSRIAFVAVETKRRRLTALLQQHCDPPFAELEERVYCISHSRAQGEDLDGEHPAQAEPVEHQHAFVEIDVLP